MKDGRKTTEFWVTAVTNLFNAVLMLLIGQMFINSGGIGIWQNVIGAILLVVLPIVTMIINREYTRSRTAIKLETMLPGASSHRPEASE